MDYQHRTHLAHWLALTEVEGFTPEVAIELIRIYGGLAEAVESEPDASNPIFRPLADSMLAARLTRHLSRYEEGVERAISEGVSILTPIGEGYPRRLARIPDPPLTLFVVGNRATLEASKSAAIVGTRRPTPFGRKMSYGISRAIASEGYVVISGLAYGVDAEAHAGAIDAGGVTVAVLPSYVGDALPKGNRPLADEILKSGGTLVSEYAPGAPPTREKFVRRNRIIAALAQATIIIEGTLKSGTRHQARYARDYGIPILVLKPEDTRRPEAELPILLKNEGAAYVTSEASALAALRRLEYTDTVQSRLVED